MPACPPCRRAPDAALAEHARLPGGRRALLRDDTDATMPQDALVASGREARWTTRRAVRGSRGSSQRRRAAPRRRPARPPRDRRRRGPARVPSAADGRAPRSTPRSRRPSRGCRKPAHGGHVRHDAGLPPREIATRLGVPVETVKSRLRRGLDELRALLDADPRTRGDARRAYALLLAGPAGDASPSAASPSAAAPASPSAGPMIAWALAARRGGRRRRDPGAT
jgi:hypothetical protein